MAVNPARTHYDVLAVRDDAPVGVIKAAFNAMAKHHHPDRGGDAALFSEMTEAMSVLTDARTRADYDRELRSARSAAAPEDKSYERPTARPTPRPTTTTPPRRPGTTRTERPQTTTTPPRGASTAYVPPTTTQRTQSRDTSTYSRPAGPGAVTHATQPAPHDGHLLRLWGPMTAALALALVAGIALQRMQGPGQSIVDGIPTQILYTGVALLLGGHLLERRNALAQIGTRTVLGICTAWALVLMAPGTLGTLATGYGAVDIAARWAALVGPGPLVFLLVIATGVLAKEGTRLRGWRSAPFGRLLTETAVESVVCVAAALRDLWSVLAEAASGIWRAASRGGARE